MLSFEVAGGALDRSRVARLGPQPGTRRMAHVAVNHKSQNIRTEEQLSKEVG